MRETLRGFSEAGFATGLLGEGQPAIQTPSLYILSLDQSLIPEEQQQVGQERLCQLKSLCFFMGETTDQNPCMSIAAAGCFLFQPQAKLNISRNLSSPYT